MKLTRRQRREIRRLARHAEIVRDGLNALCDDTQSLMSSLGIANGQPEGDEVLATYVWNVLKGHQRRVARGARASLDREGRPQRVRRRRRAEGDDVKGPVGPTTIKALRALSDGPLSARSVARRLWPDSPGWHTVGNIARGADMWMKAGQFLNAMERKGLVIYGGPLWRITEKGRALLATVAG